MGGEIKLDEGTLKNASDTLKKISLEVGPKLNGLNGMSLDNVDVKAGGELFAEGTQLHNNVYKAAKKVYDTLSKTDDDLWRTAQALSQITDDADHTEVENMSLTDFLGHLGAGGTTAA